MRIDELRIERAKAAARGVVYARIKEYEAQDRKVEWAEDFSTFIAEGIAAALKALSDD